MAEQGTLSTGSHYAATSGLPGVAVAERGGDRIAGASSARRALLGIGKATGPGAAVVYLSLLVLIPLVALGTNAFDGGWSAFWSAVSNPLARAALTFSLENSLIIVAINTVTGTAVAWVLVRDRFVGKRLLSMVVDLPFALPTVVAGLTLLSLYGPDSPFHVNVEQARLGVLLALSFVTLPFSVRAVQPVLEELDLDAEEAAASLGANSHTVLRRIVLPSLAPAMLSGAALTFARALGEFGSLVFLANLPGKTESASVYIFGLFQNYDNEGAAAVALVLLVLSLAVLLLLGALRRHFLKDTRTS